MNNNKTIEAPEIIKAPKKTFNELIADRNNLAQEIEALKQKEADLKARMKAQKQVIVSDYCDGLSAEDKAAQIADAEILLKEAKVEEIEARKIFTDVMIKIKAKVLLATEKLEFVGYQQDASLPKSKHRFGASNGNIFITKLNSKDVNFTISYLDASWDKKAAEFLLANGSINGQTRNIIDDLKGAIKLDKAI